MGHASFNIGTRLTAFREAAGMNKQQLARRAGVSDVSIGYWESGTIKQIGHERLMALADALDITVSELVGDPRLTQRDAANQELALSQLEDHLKEWQAPPREVINTIEAERYRIRRQAKEAS